MLAFGSEHVGHKIRHNGVVIQREERVPEPRLDEYRVPLVAVKGHAVPLPKRRRTNANVDNEINDGPDYGHHKLGLAGRDIGVVNATNHALCRARNVALDSGKAKAGNALEKVGSKPLGERTAVIPVYLGRNPPRPGDAQWFNVHRVIVAK